MDNRLLTQLEILKLSGEKPNFSKLGREYGIDRRTVKRYYDGYAGKPATRNKPSKLDQHEAIIRQKMAIRGATIKAVYEFLYGKYGESIGTYSNFRKYVTSRGITPNKKVRGHPRFETAPGLQAQVDWKEDLQIANCLGEIFTIQVFDYKLGYSRYCRFVYKRTRTQQEVFDRLIQCFMATGGVPREILFDNMRAIVDIVDGSRRINSKAKQFAKDFGFKIKLAKPRHSYTKGKVETINKFMEWLRVYEGEFETEDDLLRIMLNINDRVNTEVCQATNVPPYLLFQKEKDMLQPLPSPHVIDSYREYDRRAKVQKDSLIVFRKSHYSVPPEYIGKTVHLKAFGDDLRIYFENRCIAEHRISDKRINYDRDHYLELLKPLVRKDDLESFAEQNLRQFDSFL